MRLINIHTLEMEEFPANPPPYAILSHRWVGKEITYEDYLDPAKRRGPSFEKIAAFCETVRTDRTVLAILDHRSRPTPPFTRRGTPYIDWAWVDTCCIDKRSSAELTEAINSMWTWYRDATICLTFLVDVPRQFSEYYDSESLRRSEWFTRGWTLQELLAPSCVLFFNQCWDVIGSKNIELHGMTKFLGQYLSEAAGIPDAYITGQAPIQSASVAQRMSWASRRKTTRKEDEAYSLFGLFDVNLPLIYGEGKRAFMRLQEEIARTSGDDSIFAWSKLYDYHELSNLSGLFAPSPDLFQNAGDIVRLHRPGARPFRVTQQDVEIEAPFLKHYQSSQRDDERTRMGRYPTLLPESYYFLRLTCGAPREDPPDHVAPCWILLKDIGDGVFMRKHPKPWEISEVPFNDLRSVLHSDWAGRVEERTIRVVSKDLRYTRRRETFVETGYRLM